MSRVEKIVMFVFTVMFVLSAVCAISVYQFG
jgi:cell division protein FtsL